MEDLLKKILFKNRLTLSLLLVLLILIFLITVLPSVSDDPSYPQHSDTSKNYNIQNTSIYPSIISDANSGSVLGHSTTNISTPSPTVSIPTPPSKQKRTPKKTPTPTPSPALPEKVSSTIQGRDEDRTLIFELLYDLINEYLFYYDQMPQIYTDKSGAPLSVSNASDQIYLYNDNKNRTNALSINLIPDTYKFRRLDTCQPSAPDTIDFVYSPDSITLCKEDLSAITYSF